MLISNILLLLINMYPLYKEYSLCKGGFYFLRMGIIMMKLRTNRYLKVFNIEEGVIIYNTKTKKTYSLGAFEYDVLTMLNGENTIEDISIKLDCNSQNIKKLIKVFHHNCMLEGDITREKKNSFKWGVLYNDTLLDFFTGKYISWLLNILFIISIPALILMFVYSYGKLDTAYFIENIGIIDLIFFYIAMIVSIAIHEIAHAVFAKIGGAFVGEIGIMMDFIMPVAYTTLCGIHLVKSRYKQFRIYMSGIACNAWIAVGSLGLLHVSQFEKNKFIFIVFSINVCLIIVNCFLFIDSDLYCAIASLAGDFQLRKHSIEAIFNVHRAKFINVCYIVLAYIIEIIAIIYIILKAIQNIL